MEAKQERGGVRRLRAHRPVRGRGAPRTGYVLLLLGRDPGRLRAEPGSQARQASADDLASLDRALDGAAAVINCAGPFARRDRRSGHRGGAARRHPVPRRGRRTPKRTSTRSRDASAERARPRARWWSRRWPSTAASGDLLVTTAMGDWTAGRRGAHRLRPEQLAPHLPGRSPPGWSPTGGGAVAAASASPADAWSITMTPGRPWSGPSPLRSVLVERPGGVHHGRRRHGCPVTWRSRRCART